MMSNSRYLTAATDDNDDLRSGGVRDAYYIGLAGLTNLGVLTLITLVRLGMFMWSSRSLKSAIWSKGFLLHILLLMSTATDLPMYASFIMIGGYEKKTYSFHRLESMFMFAALSMTISDWNKVLHMLKEESSLPFLFKRTTLLVVNLLVIGVSVANFVACWTSTDVMTYVQLPIYTAGIIVQFSSAVIVTFVMLHGGLKLSRRIQGVSGTAVGLCSLICSNIKEVCNVCKATCCVSARPRTRTSATDSAESPFEQGEEQKVEERLTVTMASNSNQLDSSQVLLSSTQAPTNIQGRGSDARSSENNTTRASTHEFVAALNRLNLVMLICASTIFVQLTLLLMNFLLGYADESNKSVGPVYFFWVFYAWFPLWGTNISLLFLISFKHSAGLVPTHAKRTPRKKHKRDKAEIGHADDAHPERNSTVRWFWQTWSLRRDHLEEGLMDGNDSYSDDDSDYSNDYDAYHDYHRANSADEATRETEPTSAREIKHANATGTRQKSTDSDGVGSLKSEHSDMSHGSARSANSQNSKDIVFFRDLGHSSFKSAHYHDYTYKG